jgi:D-cysteine desulfhydrase
MLMRTGGTLAGLALGVRAAGLRSDRTGAPVRVQGFAVCDHREFFLQFVAAQQQRLWPSFTGSLADLVTVDDGFKGIGYGKSTVEEARLLLEVARTTGVCLDPVYTLKAVRGMLATAQPDERTLFVHTGGFLGTFNSESLGVLQQALAH